MHAMGKTEILVIDDECSVADALKVILENEGFSVTLAASGRDGIECARHGKFSLAITDLRLPDMSGLDVLQTLLAENPGFCVILITSYGTPEIFAESLRCGAAGTLDKPFSPSEIVRLVTSLLDSPPNAWS
jgi:DNA-binding NtrC family response regulator